MKRIKLNSLSIAVYFVSALFVMLFVLQSCSTSTYNFSTSMVVPAAEGSVKVKKDENSNYKIDLNVIRMAEAKRLNPPKEMYIVWMETENNGRKNLGQLKSSSGFLSSTLKSSLNTVTSFKPTAFFITAENDANIQYPVGQKVLETR